MRGPTELRVPPAAAGAAFALVLGVVAILMLSPLHAERRLAEATRELPTAPAASLVLSTELTGSATTDRARAVRTAALVRLGRLREAELLERADLRRRPDDVYAARRLYEIQVLREEHGAARETRRVLGRLDPRFAAGDGV